MACRARRATPREPERAKRPPPEAIARDIRDGYLTRERALEVYGTEGKLG